MKGAFDFERVRAAFISTEARIQAEEAMGRDKDMIAVKELRAIVEKRRQT